MNPFLFQTIATLAILGGVWWLAYRKRKQSVSNTTIKTDEEKPAEIKKLKLITTWWDEKKKESMFWLIVTLILAYAAHAIFGAKFGTDTANIASAVVVLVGFHLVWWLLSKDKSWATPVIVYGIGAYLVLTWLQPADTKTIRESSLKLASKGYHSIASKLECMDSSKDKPECEEAVYQSKTRLSSARARTVMLPVQDLHVAPGGGFQKADIPSSTKVIERITWDCPQGCIVEIEHDGDRMCEVGNGADYIGDRLWYRGVYKNTKCLVTIVDPSSKRYREQFLRLPRANGINFPINLVRVIYSFGTNERIGPVDVFVTTVVTK